MNDKFDELAKGLAQSVTRRQAFKKFSLAVVTGALAMLGFATNANADPKPKTRFHCRCSDFVNYGCDPSSPTYFECLDYCGNGLGRHQCGGGPVYRFLRRFLP